VAVSCEHGNESMSSIKGGRCFDQVRDYQILKKISVPKNQMNHFEMFENLKRHK